MLEGLKLRAVKKKAPEPEKKKRFNFGTVKRAKGEVKEIDWLKDVSKSQLVHWWKIASSRKKLSEIEKKKFEQVKYYLKNKFNVELPR